MPNSVSDDSDIDDLDSSNNPGKPGRKKNPNSQAARRDQNRIAQREFRLRKQQRIRDLEARVEILSGGKDEALGEMRNILKDLMQENQTLRNLLKSLAGFIDEGAGGLLPRLGWDMADFNNFVNRSETDTAYESYQRRKKGVATPNGLGLDMGQSGSMKRPADEPFASALPKKPRSTTTSTSNTLDNTDRDTYNILVPLSAPSNATNNATNNTANTTAGIYGRAHDSAMFSDLMHGPGPSPLFIHPTPSSSSPSMPQNPFAAPNFQSYMPAMPMIDTTMPSFSSVGEQAQGQSSGPGQDDDDDDPKRNEAYKLVHYHLDNYKRNSAYCLPASLRPTLVQRTVPHESVIDRVLHPELRDRMILLRGRFDLVDCLMDYRAAVTIHGDDVLAHGNWEIGEEWLRKYGYLIDQATLNIANRWRRERGEAEIRLADIGPGEHTPGST